MLKVPVPVSAYVGTPFLILNDLYRFGKWKNPLIDTLARANGCKVQVLKVKVRTDNVILFGRAENARNAMRMFRGIEKAAQEACCDQMRLDGVAISNNGYAKSFYFGYVEGIGLQLHEKIAASASEIDEVSHQFPQTNAAYPVHTNIDTRIASAGRDAGRMHNIR